MSTYRIVPDNSTVPAATLAADDLIDLGAQAAAYLARYGLLHRGAPFHAQIGDQYGALVQAGMKKPITFTFKEQP